MARRRLNTRFLGIGLTILVVLAGSALLYKKFRRQNPLVYRAAGEAALKQQDWRTAADNLGRAASLTSKDTNLWLEYAAAAAHIDDNEYRRASYMAFRQAVQLDPQRVDAWQALVELAQSDVDMCMDPRRLQTNVGRERLTQSMGTLREAGTKLAALQANNPDVAARSRAKSILPILNIQQWMANVPITQTAEERSLPLDKQQSDEQKVAAAVADLSQLLHDDPGNVRAADTIAKTKMRQASQLLQRGQQADAFPLLDEAAHVCDEPLRADPKNAAMYAVKFDTMVQLTAMDPRGDKRKEHDKDARDALEQAQALVNPTDVGHYIRYKEVWAGSIAQTDPGRAQIILKEVIDKYPDEIGPKVYLARILQRYGMRRDEGLKVLEGVPDVPPANLSMSRRAEVEGSIYEAKLLRTDIQIDLFMLAAGKPEAAQLGDTVQKSLDALAAGHSDDWHYLKLKGRYQLKTSKIRDAIQTLSTADRFMGQAGVMDAELLKLEAESLRLGQQNNESIKVLERAVEGDATAATNVGIRVWLAQLYLEDHRPSEARRHIDWLARRLPDRPDVIVLQLQALDSAVDKDAAQKLYQRLPESTPDEVLEKTRWAVQIDDKSDAERLLKGGMEANPKDTRIAIGLANLYLQSNRAADAQRVIDEAVKANPDDAGLKIVSDTLAGKSDQARETVIKQLESITDPYRKEIGYADLARSEGKWAEELQRLQNAEKLQPNNAAVLERLYSIYLNQRDFDKAEAYADRLAAIDADQAHGLLYKVNLALAKRDVQSAVAIGRQLTTEFKEFSSSWEALGEALQAAGQYDAAVVQYKVALDKQGNNVKALRNLIDCNYKLGRLDDAKVAITDAVNKFPDNPVYRQIQVQHELTYGDPETVLPSLRDAVEKQPTDKKGYAMLAGALARAAAVKQSKGQGDDASAHQNESRDVLKRAVERWPDEFTFSLELADAYMRTGDSAAAEATIKALADRPAWKDRPAGALALAEFYAQTHKLAEAEAILRTAVAKRPNDVGLELKLSNVLQLQRKYDEALKVLDQRQDLMAVRKARAELLVSAGRAAQAETEVTDALKAAPNDAQLGDLLLFVYVNEQKFPEARNFATQLIAAHPDNLSPYYYRAQVNMESHPPDLDAAMSDLMFVRDHAPDHVESRLALADCYARKGDSDGAIHEMETALRAAPGNKLARLKLFDLYAAANPPRWIDAEAPVRDGMAIPQMKDDPDLLRRSAQMWARRGDSAKALDAIRLAMTKVPNKDVLTHDYLDILLTIRDYERLAQESSALVAAPNCPWWVFDFRARAKARAGDKDGAINEFNGALNAAGTEDTHDAATAVAQSIQTELGVDKAVELVAPRAQNSATWKLAAIPLYVSKGDRPTAVSLAQSAMTTLSTMKPAEQDELLTVLATLYLTSTPPSVDKAISMYEQILQRRPHDYLAMNNMAYVLSEQAIPPRLTEAMGYANRAFEESQKTGSPDLNVVDTRAYLMIQTGDVDGGIRILHDIVDRTSMPEPHYHLAEGYLKKNQAEDAQRELRLAMDQFQAAKAAKRPVDDSLDGKLRSAGQRADKMLADKTQAGATP